MTADVPSIAAVREADLKLSGSFCEVGVKAEVAVGFRPVVVVKLNLSPSFDEILDGVAAEFYSADFLGLANGKKLDNLLKIKLEFLLNLAVGARTIESYKLR